MKNYRKKKFNILKKEIKKIISNKKKNFELLMCEE